jgi:hypothetical protein
VDRGEDMNARYNHFGDEPDKTIFGDPKDIPPVKDQIGRWGASKGAMYKVAMDRPRHSQQLRKREDVQTRTRQRRRTNTYNI